MNSEEANKMIFEISKNQDGLMHSTSGELGVKTSLYLVFSFFIFNAAFQIVAFSKGMAYPSEYAILFGVIGAGIALLGAILLLVAAFVRSYMLFPSRGMKDWIESMGKFKQENPDIPTENEYEGVLDSLEETVSHNKSINEQKSLWITRAAYVLFVSVLFVAVSGGLSYIAYLNHPW